MHKLKIAATGLTGLVGSRVRELLNDSFDFISLTNSIMDITNKNQVQTVLNEINFDILLHLAAYTNVDSAERERDIAWKTNVVGTKNIAATVKRLKKKLILFSTDFVFDGAHPPYFESSPANPISYYGLTKYESEKVVNPEAMIIRISYPYRAYFDEKIDFVRTIRMLLNKKISIKGVSDQAITLTFIDDIAFALQYLINNFSAETFHIVGADSMSPYEAILIICEEFAFYKSLVSTTTYDAFYKDKAKRPKKGLIMSKKNYFYKMKGFREGLYEIKKQLKI